MAIHAVQIMNKAKIMLTTSQLARKHSCNFPFGVLEQN